MSFPLSSGSKIFVRFEAYSLLSDLFNYGHNKFSQAEFTAAGMNEDDVALLQFMANQEVGHATLLSDLTGAYNGSVAKQCTYHYDFVSVSVPWCYLQKKKTPKRERIFC